MQGKLASIILLFLLVVSALVLVHNVQPVNSDYVWTETIYINANGSISPPTAPISTVDKITYLLTGNIYAPIVVQRDNIIVDGWGYTVQGNGSRDALSNYDYHGIDLTSTEGVTIRNTNIAGFTYGAWVYSSSGDTIYGNNITHNNCGLRLGDNWGACTVFGNNITNNIGDGVDVGFSSGGTVYGNNVAENANGVEIDDSSGCSVYGNNISANDIYGVALIYSSNNIVYENSITMNNYGGIWFASSSDNTLCGNDVIRNSFGARMIGTAAVVLQSSSNNAIYHNNFINNAQQVTLSGSEPNALDNGYPAGGNYWSDYYGTDKYSGPCQNETGSDGIGDTSYVIDSNNTDHYPLMQPWARTMSTSTYITFSVNPVSIGSPVTCTATVSGSNPTGTVSWSTSNTTGSFSNATSTLSSGSCSTTYTDTSPGIVTMTATYSGDSSNAPSSGSATLIVGSLLVTFAQTGVGSDFTGTVVNIDGTNYTASDLPISFWWENASNHIFAFQSPLAVGSGAKEYDWAFTTGTSTLQSDSITVSGAGSVTGNYVTRVHDVALTNVTAVVPHCSTKVGNDMWVYQGLKVYVNVTVLNKGGFDENVTVTLYYNITANQIIGAQNVTVSPGQNETVAFVWDTMGVPYNQNYTLTAVATIPLDINPADNTLSTGPINVRIMGDINGDGRVDGKDIALAALAFGTVSGNARWNLDCDINCDNKIDGKDIVLVALQFGK